MFALWTRKADQINRPIGGSPLIAMIVAGVALIISGCGGAKSAVYPTVVVQPLKYGPPITTSNGAIVQFAPNPRVYAVAPSASCEWVCYRSDPKRPAGQAFLSPPAPGLRAEAISKRTIRLKYTFGSLPRDCRPKFVTLGIFASHTDTATPHVEQFPIHAMSGKATLTYPDFLPPPDVALASADVGNGISSRTVKVLIRR